MRACAGNLFPARFYVRVPSRLLHVAPSRKRRGCCVSAVTPQLDVKVAGEYLVVGLTRNSDSEKDLLVSPRAL